jgi:hypothetical protein
VPADPVAAFDRPDPGPCADVSEEGSATSSWADPS